MKKLVIVIIFLCLITCTRRTTHRNIASLPKYDYSVKVIGISDGDTFDGLTQDKIEIRFRIYGIDAPEKKQAFSDKSKKYLSDLIYGEKVSIKVQKKRDGFGRPIVWVYTPSGKDVGAEMLKAGMAWHFKEYDNSQEYAEIENAAKANRIGLWGHTSQIPPWDYRKKSNSQIQAE